MPFVWTKFMFFFFFLFSQNAVLGIGSRQTGGCSPLGLLYLLLISIYVTISEPISKKHTDTPHLIIWEICGTHTQLFYYTPSKYSNELKIGVFSENHRQTQQLYIYEMNILIYRSFDILLNIEVLIFFSYN